MHCLRRISAALAAAAIAVAMPALSRDEPSPSGAPELALMGSIPLYWGEASGIEEMLGGGQGHWARPLLERAFVLSPLDFLTEDAISGHSYLLMAQPRALAPSENVVLDEWVRGGGRLLLFADPLMTGESRFPLGDRRRPQDAALLSPILGHWGLELFFDHDQQAGVRTQGDMAIPVNLAGSLSATDEAGACTVEQGGLVARCAIGTGHALILADAALLDVAGPLPGAESALAALFRQAFSAIGEIAGEGGDELPADGPNPPFAPVATAVEHVLEGTGPP